MPRSRDIAFLSGRGIIFLYISYISHIISLKTEILVKSVYLLHITWYSHHNTIFRRQRCPKFFFLNFDHVTSCDVTWRNFATFYEKVLKKCWRQHKTVRCWLSKPHSMFRAIYYLSFGRSIKFLRLLVHFLLLLQWRPDLDSFFDDVIKKMLTTANKLQKFKLFFCNCVYY